jgi:hypothetical protein
MLTTARHILAAHPETLSRDALGLAALCTAILAGLFLPVLA